jgi:VIT1/CCC1 family predicted Fe2+/Mn2+ transporter/rubrerythrin
MAEGAKTRINLQVALAGEADANRRYTAYGIRALQEGYMEIAQIFFEAAGAESVHAYSHLAALHAIGTTAENLRTAARGETGEIEQMYPRMIAEAEAEGDRQAAASFRLALEREKYHQQMFRQALAAFQASGGQAEPRTTPLPPPLVSVGLPQVARRDGITAELGMDSRDSPRAGVDRATARRGLTEIEGERERITRLAGIREVVFGGQDGLISTTTLVAGIAATTSQNSVVLVAGALATLAGALSMGVGSYLASRAQRQLYEAELANEQREIAEKPGEEMAELLAALIARGMPRPEAIAVTRRMAAYPGLMIDLLGAFELGLIPEGLGSPIRDAIVTAVAFMAGSVVPLLPFLFLGTRAALFVTMLLALAALFALGAVKARLSGRPVLTSGLEVVVLGGAAGVLGYALGRLVSTLFGISI